MRREIIWRHSVAMIGAIIWPKARCNEPITCLATPQFGVIIVCRFAGALVERREWRLERSSMKPLQISSHQSI